MQPSQIGPYTVSSRLGRGGMGAVYEATDPGTDSRVAVKVLASHLADDPGLRKRFTSEIETLRSLRHPGIVQLLAFGEEDDQPYFAMELVRGKSLEHALRTGRRFNAQETVAVGLAVCRALKAAHDHGIVHRDLKPANLLISQAALDAGDLGGGVKLADFGIAKLFGGLAHTAHGNIVGTAEYMAPEQAAGTGVDHRADLYALGLVMFAMLTGRPPFLGRQVTEVIEKQRREPAPRVASLARDVPAELDALIDRLLAKDPAARPANALAVGRLLSAIDASSVASTPPPATPELPLDLFAPTQDITPAPQAAAPPIETAYAATQAFTGRLPGETTQLPSRAAAASVADKKAATGSDGLIADESRAAGATTVVDRTVRNRFTTVEELDKAAQQQAERERASQRRWQIATAIATAAVLGIGGWLLLKPPTADTLYARIKSVQAAAEAGDGSVDLRDARPAIDLFLARHGADPRAAEVRALDRSLDLDALEKRARRRVRGNRALSPIERDYRAAMDREATSPSDCKDSLEALLAIHADTRDRKPAEEEETLWLALVRRQIERLVPLAANEEAEDEKRIASIFTEADALAAGASSATSDAQRAELLAKRRSLLEGLVELYASRPHAAAAVETAKAKLAE
jgi:serine/threonine protein kinase